MPGTQTVVDRVVMAGPPQPQQIIIFSNYNHPTVQLGQDGTPLPQVQPFVILGQQTQPVFRPEGTTVNNVQSQPAEYGVFSVTNAAANHEPGRHESKKGGDHGDSL